MSNVNTVAVSGNLVADGDKKVTKANGEDFTILNLRMACNRSRKVGDEWVEEASFFDVTVFGKFGDLCDRKLRKGDALTVTGRLEQQRWETTEGDKRSKVVIIADTIDSPSFFKKDDDVAAKESGDSTTAAPASDPAASDDDIPF